MEQQDTALKRAMLVRDILADIAGKTDMNAATLESTAFLASQYTDLADDWLMSMYKWVGEYCQDEQLAQSIKTKLEG